VYIRSSLSRTLYTGVTNHLERHVAEHKERRLGSFTALYNIDRLITSKHSTILTKLLPRKNEIKQMARRTKIRLISTNSQRRDLSTQ
jgi:putative endonuclease